MELRECLSADRATRDFADRSVPIRTVERLIDYARRAGSGHNRQPWTFIALRERENIDTLAAFGEYTTPLRRAPLGLVLAVDGSDSRHRREHNVFDCGRAGQNLMLAAAEAGLGTVPQGLRDRGSAGSFLDLPPDKRVLIGFAVGYPASTQDETIEGVDKDGELDHPGRKPVDELLHWETHA
ncbi:nitroreductase family protein [Halomarina halobia]|uniref:Nitroreductase family protein n=1 Tax=Halomarina halobia TaxID=3033386 RepID=A0ABD6AEQ7_9EURY|nr:nitroreductase family protein [Halomarina sp. PSR21]